MLDILFLSSFCTNILSVLVYLLYYLTTLLIVTAWIIRLILWRINIIPAFLGVSNRVRFCRTIEEDDFSTSNSQTNFLITKYYISSTPADVIFVLFIISSVGNNIVRNIESIIIILVWPSLNNLVVARILIGPNTSKVASWLTWFKTIFGYNTSSSWIFGGWIIISSIFGRLIFENWIFDSLILDSSIFGSLILGSSVFGSLIFFSFGTTILNSFGLSLSFILTLSNIVGQILHLICSFTVVVIIRGRYSSLSYIKP